jgi:hypothetical protein
MQTYQEIKAKIVENKAKIVLGICFILVFIIGFGTGSYEKEIRRNTNKTTANYTTQPSKKPTTGQGTVAGATTGLPPVAAATSTPTGSCIIKGNVSSSGRKIYHVPSGALYKVVKPEQCFNTEAEALAAGFVKSGR